MKVASAILAAFMLLPRARANAQTAVAGVPDLDVHEFKLKNGLVVLVLEDHATPVMSVQVWYRVGSRNELPGKTGLAHLFEHMMFKGSKHVAPEEHARRVQEHGGVLNAYTTHDATTYYENVSSDQLDLCLSLEAERMANLNLSKETLASERDVVKEERRMRTDNSPQGQMMEEVFALAYRAHPYRAPIVGWMEDLDLLTVKDCANFYRSYYAPNDATLVVAGDVKSAEVLRLAKKYFGPLKKSDVPPMPAIHEPPQRGERRADVRAVAELPQIYFAWHIPGAGDPDIRALEILGQVLSHGDSSRLHKSLVYEQRLAVSTSADVYEAADPGLFFGSIDMQEGHTAEEGEKAFRAEIDRVVRDGITEEELARGKQQAKAQFVFQMASVSSRARQIGHYQTSVGDWRYANQVLPALLAVTRDDVSRVARKYLAPDNLSVVRLTPIRPTDAPASVSGAAQPAVR